MRLERRPHRTAMINYLAILLSHALIAWLCYTLMLRDDVDSDPAGGEPASKARRPRRTRKSRDA